MATSTPLLPPQPSSTFVQSTPTPSPGSQAGNGVPTGITPAGSSLYLFTFLTTLLLLLGVSCAIIIRSLILRRRFRRRVAEAIANGVFVPGLMDRPAREIGEKPKMFDVWLGEPVGQLDITKKEASMQESEGWNDILPIAATQVIPPSAPKKAYTPTGSAHGASSHRPHTIFSRLLASNNNNRPTPPSPAMLEAAQPPTSAKADTDPSSKDKDKPQTVQVSLLIAMPSASRPSAHSIAGSSSTSTLSHSQTHSEDDPKGKLKASTTAVSAWHELEEGEIPHLELAVLEVGYRGEKRE